MTKYKIPFLNTFVDNVTMDQALQCIDELIEQNNCSYVITPNVDHIVRIYKDAEFKAIYDEADLILTDGQPLIWVSKLFGKPIIEKVSGSDLFPLLCEHASKKNYSMFFLGAAEGVADKAATVIRSRYSNINIINTYSPPFGFEKNEKELAKICRMVISSNPDILILALGCPKQEKFIYKHRKEIGVPISLCLGASLDFIAGSVTRAPKWMSRVGLEWLFRIFQEPKRMIKRYLLYDIKIVMLLIRYYKHQRRA